MLNALLAFCEFLTKFSERCLLIAHNDSFDVSFLIREIQKHSLVQEFQKIIYGFCDSLKLFGRKFPSQKGKGMFTFSKLAEAFLENNVLTQNFHKALYCVIILKQIVTPILQTDDLFKNSVDYMTSVNKLILDKKNNR